jgi:hypothetical protein
MSRPYDDARQVERNAKRSLLATASRAARDGIASVHRLREEDVNARPVAAVLLAKANLLLWRGHMYRPGPPEDFFDCMTGDVVTRADLAHLGRGFGRPSRTVGDTWKLQCPKEATKNDEAHVIALHGEARAIVERAWGRRRPDCDLLFHVDGKPLGSLRSEFRRTCKALGIPYGRGRGVIRHDTSIRR